MLNALGIELNPREVMCFLVAAVLHGLLFMWKGGLLDLHRPGSPNLGDALVAVGYMPDLPEYDEPTAPAPAAAKKSFLGKVKNFFVAPTEKPSAPKPVAELAGGNENQKIEPPAPAWQKTSEALVNKKFSTANDFKGIETKRELAVATGQPADAVIENKPIPAGFVAKPNLKERASSLAKRDTPFKISSVKDMDSLSNVNMIPVSVGKTTSPSIKSLEEPVVGSGGRVSPLQSKSFGGANAGGAGFGGLSRTPGNSGSGGLLSGSGKGSGDTIDASGSGFGTSADEASGGGATPFSPGRGANGGTGKGLPGTGGAAVGQPNAMLPRRQLTALQDVVTNTSRNTSDVTISGELSNRPIKERVKPGYELDARVVLRFRVNSAGHVLDGIMVDISSGSPSFDQKVMTALKKWIFATLPNDKSNVTQEGLITFIFRGE